MIISADAGEEFGPMGALGPFIAIGTLNMIGGDAVPNHFAAMLPFALLKDEAELGLHTFGEHIEVENGQERFAIQEVSRGSVLVLTIEGNDKAQLSRIGGAPALAWDYNGACEALR